MSKLQTGEKYGCVEILRHKLCEFKNKRGLKGSYKRGKYEVKCSKCNKKRWMEKCKITICPEYCSETCKKKFNYSIVPKHKYQVKIGDTFGRLIVIENPTYKYSQSRKSRVQICKVQCACEDGKIFTTYCRYLKQRVVHSCGCAKTNPICWLAKNGQKKCFGCERILDIQNFGKHSKCKDGYNPRCIECARDKQLKLSYGISLKDYNSILDSQEYKCKICGKKREEFEIVGKKLFVDHCHKTGKVRGILCTKCNTGIGMFDDSIENLEAAISYLKENSA